MEDKIANAEAYASHYCDAREYSDVTSKAVWSAVRSGFLEGERHACADLRQRLASVEKERDELRESVKSNGRCGLPLAGDCRAMIERDQLRDELTTLKNPSDGRCMEIGALRKHVKTLSVELERVRELVEAAKVGHDLHAAHPRNCDLCKAIAAFQKGEKE